MKITRSELKQIILEVINEIKWNIVKDPGSQSTYYVDDKDKWQIWKPYGIKMWLNIGGGKTEAEKEMKKGNKFWVQWSTTDGKKNNIKWFKDMPSANSFVKELKNKLK